MFSNINISIEAKLNTLTKLTAVVDNNQIIDSTTKFEPTSNVKSPLGNASSGDSKITLPLIDGYIHFSKYLRYNPITDESINYPSPWTIDQSPRSRKDISRVSRGEVKISDKYEDTFIDKNDGNKTKKRVWYNIKFTEGDDPFKIGDHGWMVEDGVEPVIEWEDFIQDVKKWESSFKQRPSIKDLITLLRRLSQDKRLNGDKVAGIDTSSFNTKFGSKYLDDITYEPKEWQLFKDYTKVNKKGKLVDINHLLYGLDALVRQEDGRQKRFIEFSLNDLYPDGFPPTWVKKLITKTFDIGDNIAAITWSADTGAAVTDMLIGKSDKYIKDHINTISDPIVRTSEMVKFYFKTRCTDSDLWGDVLSWGLFNTYKAFEKESKLGSHGLSDVLTSFVNSNTYLWQERKGLESFLKYYLFDISEARENFLEQAESNRNIDIFKYIFLYYWIWLYVRRPVFTAIFENSSNFFQMVDAIRDFKWDQINEVSLTKLADFSYHGIGTWEEFKYLWKVFESPLLYSKVIGFWFLKWIDEKWVALSGNKPKTPFPSHFDKKWNKN